METAYKDGKLRAIGISNFLEDQYLDLVNNCKVIPAVNQVETHVFRQQKKLRQLECQIGTKPESWSPLACGQNGIFKNLTLLEIANHHGKSVARIALRFLLQQGVVVIPKSTHMLEFFFDRERGGLYPYASDGEQLLTRTKEACDGAMPSGNSVAALVLSRLAFLEELWPSAELVVTAREIPEELQPFLRRIARPELTVLVKTPRNTDELAALAPFTKDYPIPERGARHYLCRSGTCAQPVDSIAELETLLGQNNRHKEDRP